MDVGAQSNLWAMTGSIYAIAGAALLWASTLASPLAGAAMSAAGTASQRLDARFGAGLLTIGLFLQATGAATNPAALTRPATFMLAGLAFLLLFYALAKDMIIVDPASSSGVSGSADHTAKPQLIAQADAPLEIEDLRTVALRQRS